MAKLDPGKWAEAQAKDWMDKFSSENLSFAYHRYPDAKAARGALAKQPSDYLVAFGTVYHIEVKETKQVNRLPKSKVRQYGMLLKFYHGNIHPYVIVYRSEVGDWIYLGASELFCFEDCPPSFDMTSRPKYHTFGDAMCQILSKGIPK